MKTEEIAAIGVDELGRIYIAPSGQTFEYIYRSAADVRWDSERLCLHSPIPREWSLLNWYQHIVGIAEVDYGVALKVTSNTQWTNVDPGLKSQIEALT